MRLLLLPIVLPALAFGLRTRGLSRPPLRSSRLKTTSDYRSKEGKRCLPPSLFEHLVPLTHGSDSSLLDPILRLDIEDVDRLEQDLERLKREVQQKRLFLETAELTIRRAEEALAKRQNSTMFKCTEYGYSVFENKSYEKTVDAVPKSAFKMGIATILKEIRTAIHGENLEGLSPEVLENRAKIKQLKLSNDAIWARESKRPPIKAPWVIKGPYLILCLLLDALFESSPIGRFYFLETVARMPYFSYITMLHTYETLGE